MATNAAASGKFVVTHKLVLSLAVPMTLAYLSTPLLGIVDTAVIGRLGDPAMLGGLAIGALLVDTVATTFNFLRSGTTGLTSQALGAEEKGQYGAILARAIFIALVCGLVLAVLAPALLWMGLALMKPGEAVATATSSYFLIRILSMPFALTNFSILGWLIGLGRANLTLVLQLLLNGINIALSIYLGLWLELGIAGVAWATVIAEIVTSLIGATIAFRIIGRTNMPNFKRVMKTDKLKQLVSLNADIMVRSFALIFAFGFFTAQGAKLGEVTLAANAVLLHFFFVAGYFLDGLATAAEQLVGRAVGAKQKEAFRRSLLLTTVWSFTLAIMLAVIFWVGAQPAINLMTTSTAVREQALFYLPWAVLIPVTAVMAFELDGVYIGATWSRDMSIMMVLSTIAYVAVYYAFAKNYGNSGLWFALHVFVSARALTLGWRLPANFRRTFYADNDVKLSPAKY